MGTTTNYSWEYPDNNADEDTWGLILIAMSQAIDATVFTNQGLSLLKAGNLSGLADTAIARTNLGVAIGTNVQAFHANLTAFAGLTLVADRLPYANGAGTLALATFTSFARTLLDDADATTMRGTLGLGTSAIVNTGTSGTTIPLNDGANTWSAKQTYSAGADMTPAAVPTTTAVGYLGTPQVIRTGSYGLAMTDAGKDQYSTTGGTATIPANGSVAFPIGTKIQLSVVAGQVLAIAITTDTLRWIPPNSTGTRSLTGPGECVIDKKTATEWWVYGTNLS